MKRIIYLVTVICVAIISSCSDDFTNLSPIGTVSSGNYWKSERDAVEATNGMYYYMKDEDMFGRGFFWYIHASDDMITGRTNGKARSIRTFTTRGTESYTYWMYPQCYKIIRRANDILANVPKMTNIKNSVKNRILGEAYFMRAFHYFWLAHTYGDDKSGGVPIVTVKNMNSSAGSFKRPKSVTENYVQIIEDLKKASELLPLYTKYSKDDYGRAHKDAALAYIAKTYLYWAQYDNTKWGEVVKYCDAVTNSGSGRALINTGNPTKDYRELHSYLNNWTSEYIWSVNSGIDGGSKLPGVMLENKGWGQYNGWGYYQPTQELYDEFEAGDARREVTILKFNDEFKYFGKTIKYWSTNSRTGYQFNKYMYEYQFENPKGVYINNNGDAPTTLYNVPILRYAEILLMKSEALIMQGKNGDAPLNVVRKRAGLLPVSGATLKDLKHERRVEFAGEFANRHFDLVRWGDAKEVYSKPSHGRVHKDKSDPTSPYEIKEVYEGRKFDPNYMNIWPIPAEAVKSSGINQNKRW